MVSRRYLSSHRGGTPEKGYYPKIQDSPTGCHTLVQRYGIFADGKTGERILSPTAFHQLDLDREYCDFSENIYHNCLILNTPYACVAAQIGQPWYFPAENPPLFLCTSVQSYDWSGFKSHFLCSRMILRCW